MTAKLATIRLRGAGALAAVLLGGSCAVQPRPAPPAQTASLSPVDSIRVYTAACGQGLATGSSLSPGSATACTNLGRMYRDGRGVEQDSGRAVELFTRVCDGMPAHPDDQDAAAAAASACSLLGAQYAHGSGVPEDWGRAIALSRQGCDGGDAFGCFNLGAVYLNGEGADRDGAAALAFFRRACDLRDGKGCFQVGLMHYQGQGATRSDELAAAFFRKACDAGDGTGCVNLGGFYTSDVSRKLALFERGCDLGEPLGCFNLANHYTDGTGVKADPARAAALYAQACSAGYEAACAKASTAH